MDDGVILIREDSLMQQLASRLHKYPECDQPKHVRGLHVAIGFLKSHQPFSIDEEQARFRDGLVQMIDISIGRAEIQKVWLVHYANRSLSHIRGKVPFMLGRANSLSPERMLQELDIIDTYAAR